MRQLVFQLAVWHVAHAMLANPPERSAPWHAWQDARPRSAENAWKSGLDGSIHDATWPAVTSTWPSRCLPAGAGIGRPSAVMLSGWQMEQPVRSLPTAGWLPLGGRPWHVPHASARGAVQTGAFDGA